MGTVLIKLKIMPTSPDVNLEEIKEITKTILEKNSANNPKFEEEPIAFGLKAIIASFDMDESKALEPIESAIRNLENVSSAEVSDMRRAFG